MVHTSFINKRTGFRHARWVLAPSLESERPVIYHCISRVVDRRFAFQADEKEKLRMFMRVRYFIDGAVIGSRASVNEMFERSRDRFGPKRKDGARKLRGNAGAASGMLWSLRDLRLGV